MSDRNEMPQQSVLSGANMTIQQWYDAGLRTFQGAFTVLVQPVEYLLRPQFGTQYFSPITTFFSCALMFVLGGFGAVGSFGAFGSGGTASGPSGLVGLTSMAALYFLGNVIHGIRVYRLMLHPDRENHSEYEGSPLLFLRPLFKALPLGTKFWPVRIVYEPLTVMAAATLLHLVHLLDTRATTYLAVTAVALCLKSWMEWYRAWLHIRRVLDAKAMGAVMADMVQGTATDAQMASIHIAGFPDSVSQRDKAAAIARSAGVLDPSIANLISPVESKAA